MKNNTKLTYLACNYNPIASLDVSTLVNLSTLYCYGMKLDVLDVTRNIKLVSLWCNSNNLKKLDISQNKMLEDVSIDQNMIRDNEMTAIVEALPDLSEAEYPGFFYVYNEEKKRQCVYHRASENGKSQKLGREMVQPVIGRLGGIFRKRAHIDCRQLSDSATGHCRHLRHPRQPSE